MPWRGGSATGPVRGIIQWRVGAETVVMPIDRLLTEQRQVIRFCWHPYGNPGMCRPIGIV